MFKTVIIGVVITVVGLFALTAVSKIADKNNTNNNYNTTYVSQDESSVKVAISGEINHPGDYYISPEKTLGDLIDMAGGTTSDADTNTYNESVLISTHSSFYIAPISSSSTCADSTISKININTASDAKLQDAGFNSSQSSNLIDYRTTNGSFQTLEEILDVKGIGLATFEKVKNKICIM